MALSVDDQGAPAAIQNLPANEVGGIAVTKLDPPGVVSTRNDAAPIDWGIAGNYSQLPGTT